MKKITFVLLFIGIINLSCKEKNSLPDPLQAGWKGESVCKVIHEDKKLRILKCTFAPGVGHEKHKHQPHFGYTLQGGTFKITDTTGTKTVHVKTGTTWSKDKVTQHEVLNVGDSTSVYLIVEHK
ncbi:cupin domain-containing protein [Oceanihabitans sp. 1_MG-2023]|uniref:cupin domain-containing protein n=1 Tax=Flavobacteriaceae TaxID=49546 RepID=UPI0020901DC4|nr:MULTISPECIES: cupin domain-containing protein [Flavobacteriaceae]MDO6622069.1 cupin domain-containing protein [Oceanihabitans sp. 1_MG-2023]